MNNKTGDDRPVTTFYHETKNRSQNGEEVAERRTASEKKKKQSEGKEDVRAVSEPDKAKDDQRKVEDDQKNPEDCSTAASGEDPPSRAQTEDHHPKPSTSNAPRTPEEPPDVSDMLQFSLDAPGGACVVSLTLMTLGLLNVYMSIPKPIVVVDSNLVDNDVVKR